MERNRTGDYYLECERRIAEAENLINRIVLAENGTELRSAFIGFLEITKNLFYPLHRYKNIFPDYDRWWGEESKKLDQNAIAKFFWSKRNDVVKAGNEIINLTLRSKREVIIPGPMFYYDGEVYRPKGGRVTLDYSISGFELIWDFNEKPSGINLKGIELCKKYIKILGDVLESFMNKYPNIIIQ